MRLNVRFSAFHNRMRRRLIGRAGLVLCLILPLPALSQESRSPINFGLYQQLREGADRGNRDSQMALRLLLDGLIDGMKAMNVAYVSEGASPKLCIPVGFDVAGLRVALDELLVRHPRFNDKPPLDLGLVAKIAIEQKFPCP